VKVRRFAFWSAVFGIAVAAPFAVNLAADKIPIRGLKRFRDYIYCAPGAS
jgi:hypothetical protein